MTVEDKCIYWNLLPEDVILHRRGNFCDEKIIHISKSVNES